MNSAPEKLQFLLDLQDQLGGAIPFERWMHEALYHEKFGYYAAHVRGIGRHADFTTWPVLQDSLARAVAHWAMETKPRGRWNLIEVGAGTGDLAAGVLRAIGWWNRPSYHIVEISQPLRAEQQKRLGRKVTWHTDLSDALADCEGNALIFSNELVDAFPCRIFQKQDRSWRELALRIEESRIVEIWHDAELPDSTVFDHEWPEGQRVEVQESFHHWFRQWQSAWRKGAMLTIDYGDVCPALYHRRPHGTLRAFAHHQRLEGPSAYAGFGVRDLTVDVNFSDLKKWSGAESGFHTLGDFLDSFALATAPNLAEAAQAFKVLALDRSQPLRK
jgi:SAM-dependent MidA family methyltransferase